jgi:hypothetical protein
MDADSSTTCVLHGMRLVNPRTGEHTGPCPHCQAGTNRYHVWTEPGAGGRPAWRYWCRTCGGSGVLGASSHDHPDHQASQCLVVSTSPSTLPRPEHIPFYRQLYKLTALWAPDWLMNTANPDPLVSLAKRGVNQATAVRH